MGRIRSIKPEFFLHEGLAELSPIHRLCFIGLWTQADKAGRLKDRPRRLKMQILPYDRIKMTQIIADLVDHGFLIRYSVGDLRFLIIPGFADHQRPRVDEPESTIPAHDSGGALVITGTNQSLCSDADETAESVGKERKGREGKGKEGKGEGSTPLTRLRGRFDRFWHAYPKKVGKDAAWREWQKRAPGDDLTDRILTTLAAQRASAQWRKDSGQYIPHPRTWLHQGRWQDEPDTPAVTPAQMRTDTSGLEAFVRAGSSKP